MEIMDNVRLVVGITLVSIVMHRVKSKEDTQVRKVH